MNITADCRGEVQTGFCFIFYFTLLHRLLYFPSPLVLILCLTGTVGEPSQSKVAILSRSNACVFDQAVHVTDGESPSKIHIIGVCFLLSIAFIMFLVTYSSLNYPILQPGLPVFI